LFRAAYVALTLVLAACVSSHELIGNARAPISPDRVQLYLEAPAQPYERIAVLTASSKRSFSFSSQGKADAVVRRLKEEAAKLGANGVLLQSISDESGASIGTAVGTGYEGPRGTIDLGFGASTLMLQRYGRGIAIYLDSDGAASRRTPP
jgi:hypothetical protein